MCTFSNQSKLIANIHILCFKVYLYYLLLGKEGSILHFLLDSVSGANDSCGCNLCFHFAAKSPLNVQMKLWNYEIINQVMAILSHVTRVAKKLPWNSLGQMHHSMCKSCNLSEKCTRHLSHSIESTVTVTLTGNNWYHRWLVTATGGRIYIYIYSYTCHNRYLEEQFWGENVCMNLCVGFRVESEGHREKGSLCRLRLTCDLMVNWTTHYFTLVLHLNSLRM